MSLRAETPSVARSRRGNLMAAPITTEIASSLLLLAKTRRIKGSPSPSGNENKHIIPPLVGGN